MDDFRAPRQSLGLVIRLRRLRTAWLGKASVLGPILRDRLSLLHREVLPMIAVFAVVLLIGLGLVLQQPVLFTAQASMTVPRDQGLSFSSWSHVTGAAPDNMQGGVTQSAMDDLSSQRLILQTIETIGLGKLYPDLVGQGAAGQEAALRRVSKTLKLQQAAGSNHLALSFSHKSASMAALVVNTLMQAYMAEHGRRLGQLALTDRPVALAVANLTMVAVQQRPQPQPIPDSQRSALERQLDSELNTLSRIERALLDQTPMVSLSLQGVTNSLRADGQEHSFGFNTQFQALQIERQHSLIAISNLTKRLARIGDPAPVARTRLQVAPADLAWSLNPDPNLKTASGLDTVRIINLAKPPLHSRHQGGGIGIITTGFGAVLALMTGLVLSERRSGFGSAKLAGQRLDLPVLSRIGVLPPSRAPLSRLGLG